MTSAPPYYKGSKSFTTTEIQPYKPKNVITYGWDWIEFTATLNKHDNDLIQPTFHKIEQSKRRSAHYNNVYNISKYCNGKYIPFVTINTSPRVSFIDKKIVQIKVENNWCYDYFNLVKNIQLLLSDFNLKFKNYIRLDTFIDFQKIDGFNCPSQLMQQIAENKVRIKNKSKITIHKSAADYNGISFGSRKSNTYTVMYNKTKEMISKSWKPHIESLWKLANFDFEQDVYRLEFSNRKTTKDIVNNDGETLGNFEDIKFLDNLFDYIKFNYSTHFHLHKNEKNNVTRSARIDIFNIDTSAFTAQTTCIKAQSNNHKKSYIKKLLFDALFEQNNGNAYESSALINHAIKTIDNYNLQKWYKLNLAPLFEFQSKNLFDYINNQLIKTTLFTQSSLNFYNSFQLKEFQNVN